MPLKPSDQLCIVLCLVEIGGFMHFWGLTIDTVTCNHLIIAIGLCVDYSAHIAHRFLVERGTRNGHDSTNSMYRVTHHVDSNLPVTSKQKLRFSPWASY